MHHWWLVESLLQVDFEVLQVSEMQSQTRTRMVKGLAFGMHVKLGVVMLYAKRPMTRRQKDRWRLVRVLRVSQLAVFGEDWVAQEYSIATRE